MRNLFSRNLRTVALGLLASVALALPGSAAVTSLKTLSGHVPLAVQHLTPKGDLEATNVLTLAIGLPLHNTNDLNDLLQQVYDPTSSNYHHYLNTAEFTARFGPTAEDYQSTIDFARANGFEITGTHSNRMILDVRAKVPDIERTFHLKMKRYRHPLEPRDFYAADSDPSISSSLPISHISGLENFASAKPLLARKPNGGGTSLGTAPGGAYAGQDFRNAYVPGTALNGTGQNVALFQLDGFFASDIAAYASLIGLTNPPALVTVPVDGGVPVPTSFGNSEVSLDIEMVMSISPGVSNIYVYEAPNFTLTSIYTVFEDIFSRIASDNLSKQVSCSWYVINGQQDPIGEQIFQQMAIEGQSVFAASGDFDAYTGVIPFPCDSPHITLVGGTTLTTRRDQSYISETVWNWDSIGLDGTGSSGGISTAYTLPSWQTNVSMAANQGSATMRNVPDVALTADNVYVLFGSGQNGIFGGTSCAAPLWAGYMALVNQQAKNNGVAPVGFLNPALYSIANSANYTNCFHDVVSGNNEWSGSPSKFSAVPGYDLCTGLGTPNGNNLINALASGAFSNTVTHISPPTKPYGGTLSVLNGSNPNGTWNLFVMDDTKLNVGIISNGWALTLVTGNTVGYTGDDGVTVTASSTNVSVLNSFAYYITVTNYGPSVSTNVVVEDILPSGLTLLSSNLTIGSLVQSGTTRNWNVGTLSNGIGGNLILTVNASTAGTYTDFASVQANTPDANPDDDTASATVVVGTVAPPSLSSVGVISGHKFQMNITSLGNQTNVVQASTNLVNPNGWVPIYTNVGPFTFQDLQATNYPTRFYRDVITGP